MSCVRHCIAVLILTTATVLALAGDKPVRGPATEVYKTRDIKVVETTLERGVYFSYERCLKPEEAREVFKYAHQRSWRLVSPIYCASKDRRWVLCSADTNHESEDKHDYGHRMILMERGDEVREAAHTHGAADSYILRPVLFYGPDSTLILAEMGTEYSWGYTVVEFTGKKLKVVGDLDVSVKEKNAYCMNATQHMAVKRIGGRWVVEFDVDEVIVGCGSKDQKTVKRPQKGKPIVFRYDGKKFVND
jgi:hypothetical protein